MVAKMVISFFLESAIKGDIYKELIIRIPKSKIVEVSLMALHREKSNHRGPYSSHLLEIRWKEKTSEIKTIESAIHVVCVRQ
jgi:hypothetical protein